MYAMYDALADWYPLLTPPEDYAEEAAAYRAVLDAEARPLRTLLELGCGAGHNAVHMKAGLECVLSDLSPRMLEHSRRLNPDCAHVLGDMRTLRLDRTFDAVFLHDAVAYLTTREDLLAAARTAAAHLQPGGVALFAPDDLADDFEEYGETWQHDYADRSVRMTEWTWRPSPDQPRIRTEYVWLLREGGAVTVHHETHVQGLFSAETWLAVLAEAGLQARRWDHALEGEVYPRFVARKPGAVTPSSP